MGIGRVLLLAAVVAGGLVALVVTIAVSSGGRSAHVEARNGQTIQLTPAETHGRELFAARCSGCHTLRAVHGVAQVGPSLDFLRPPAAVVRRRIHEGSQASNAVMPAEIFTGSEADDVAAFVARVAGR